MLLFVRFLNSIVETLFQWIFWPFQSLNPIWPLLFVSGLCGLFMVWIFKLVSNQNQIRLIRNRIRGNLLAVRLYRNDIRIVLRLQRTILGDTLSYMRYSLVPMLVLTVPVLLILAQLNLYFSVRPLHLEESAIVKLKLSDKTSVEAPISLEAPPEVAVETPPVRIASLGEVVWRIRPGAAGRHLLTLHLQGERIEKEVVAGSAWEAVSTLRTSSPLQLLLYPGEQPLNPVQTVEAIEVIYPSAELYVFNFPVHWLVFFLIVSIAVGFALKGLVGVEI